MASAVASPVEGQTLASNVTDTIGSPRPKTSSGSHTTRGYKIIQENNPKMTVKADHVMNNNKLYTNILMRRSGHRPNNMPGHEIPDTFEIPTPEKEKETFEKTTALSKSLKLTSGTFKTLM